MDEHIIIRKMRYSDLDDLEAVEKASFSVPWTRGMLEEEYFNIRARYRVIEFRGKIAGYIGMLRIMDEGHITNVEVRPEYSRKGQGNCCGISYHAEQQLESPPWKSVSVIFQPSGFMSPLTLRLKGAESSMPTTGRMR